MNLKLKIKISIDILMSIVLFVLMSYQFTEQKKHEIAGAIMLVLFIFHHALNYKWFTSLGKGKYSKIRILTLVVDILLFVGMISLMLSGIGMSRYVFRFLDFDMSQNIARSTHMVASYGSFLLMSIHIGLHYNMILLMIHKIFGITKPNRVRTVIYTGFIGGISIYAIYALIKRKFILYITLQMHFVFFDYDEPIIFYEIDLLTITLLMVFVGYYLQRLLSNNSIKSKGVQI